jgi:hypothetical protein
MAQSSSKRLSPLRCWVRFLLRTYVDTYRWNDDVESTVERLVMQHCSQRSTERRSKSIYQVKSESIPSQTPESRKEKTKLNKIHSRIGLGVGLGLGY